MYLQIVLLSIFNIVNSNYATGCAEGTATNPRLNRMGRLPGMMGRKREKDYKHSGFITNIPDL
jgi:hypothetical protein